MFHLHCLFSLLTATLSNLLLIAMHLIWIAIILTLIMILLFAIFYWIIRRILAFKHKINHKKLDKDKLDMSIAFFHPYCNAGGGGEKVLWCAIKAVQEKYPHVRCIVYTGDVGISFREILKKAKKTFNLTLTQPVEFIYLNWRNAVEPSQYPYFTLLAQSVGSMVLGMEALFKFVPTIYIDTMGYAFTLPIFRYLGNCKVGCYVHYPTISTDMLDRVAKRRENYNNTGIIAKNEILSGVKIIYYRIFAFVYGIVGRTSQLVMVNSSWTEMHILNLWRMTSITYCVYPPCDVSSFQQIPIECESREVENIVSVAQFRPEKDHFLQIKSFNEFLKNFDENQRFRYKLVLIGSCRNVEDEERVKKLEELCRELGIEKYVEFKLNISFDELKIEMEKGKIALHTMENEHFGIGVVEAMAAGLVVLAHDSGGPKMNIVVEFNGFQTGFLASDVSSYAGQMVRIFEMNSDELVMIRRNARSSVKRFSEEEFSSKFLNCMQLLLQNIPV